MTRSLLRVRWLFPTDGLPLADAVVEVQDGRVIGTGRGDASARDLGSVALIPGLVNAHTHLEFSDLTEPLTPSLPFPHWIRALIAHRRARTTPATALVTRGLRECHRHGTTAVGEISTDDGALLAERAVHTGPRCVIFRELLGLSPERAAEQMQLATAHLDSAPTNGGLLAPRAKSGSLLGERAVHSEPRVIHGLSPHAPYTVRPELFQQAVSLATEYRVPLAMHLAETPAERELLEWGTGELAEMLRDFGVWQDGLFPTMPLVEYLKTLAGVPCGLVIHGNYLTAEEIEFLAGCPQLTVVYCPRTHAYFEHTPHPWRELVRRGVRVALGTDSRASNPDLDLWQEALFLRRRHPDILAAEILHAATVAGEEALFGVAPRSLLGRNVNELTLIDLPSIPETDPYRLLFHSQSRARPAVEILNGPGEQGP